MQAKDQERLRRLRGMFGRDFSQAPTAEDVGRQADRSDEAIKAVMIHPDGREERLRMFRGVGKGGHGESPI